MANNTAVGKYKAKSLESNDISSTGYVCMNGTDASIVGEDPSYSMNIYLAQKDTKLWGGNKIQAKLSMWL